MLYLLWALVNMALFVLLIYTCIRLTRIINRKHGTLAAFIGVWLLVGLHNHDDNGNHRVTEQWALARADSLAPNTHEYAQVVLNRDWLSVHKLHVGYGQEKQTGWLLANTTTTSTSGLTGGAKWRAEHILVAPRNNGKTLT